MCLLKRVCSVEHIKKMKSVIGISSYNFNHWKLLIEKLKDDRATCDERNLAYPCHPKASVIDNYGLYSFETGGIWHYNIGNK